MDIEQTATNILTLKLCIDLSPVTTLLPRIKPTSNILIGTISLNAFLWIEHYAQRGSIGEGEQQLGVLIAMVFAARFCEYHVMCSLFPL
ncbi:hypothetical protein ACX0G7_26045 [Flavitalea antarctica]